MVLIKGLIILACVAALASCTWVHYADDTRQLTVIDWHPAGEAITLEGIVEGAATLDVNRETGDSSEVAGRAIQAAAAAAGGAP